MERNAMPEYIQQAFYYAAIHLIFASIVCLVALALTSVRRGSATTKYWIWTATSVNFFLPLGAMLDRMWATHLGWARPIGIIGGEMHDILENATVAVLLGVVWLLGATLMLVRLCWRIRAERRCTCEERPGFLAHGVPVQFSDDGQGPQMAGVLRPRISLPDGIHKFLSEPEIDAVLIHELTHARRRDNLTRLIYEAGLCVLWFHPLVWLAGSRLALYRELSCDERVIQSGHGGDLVSALTKLANPDGILFEQTTASSFLSHRLARLAAAQPQQTFRTQSAVLTAVFAAVFLAGVFETVAHTACCFFGKG
jgi:beta-lactamase regulating signal transducer with metallopeptidase domain